MKKNEIKKQEGFTLVELSIVLVIIGLIIGGILAGQDMIKAAELRATIAQVEKYNTSVNTFRSKYGSIPGDMRDATNFGFLTRTEADGHGDGDGQLEGCALATASNLGCETGLFWVDLATANLMDGDFSTATDAASGALATSALIEDYLPQAKLGKGNMFHAYSANGLNYYHLSGMASADAAGVLTTALAMTPNEAFGIDDKIDDGRPLTGTIVSQTAVGTLSVAVAAGEGNDDAICVDEGTAGVYNTDNAESGEADGLLCQLRFRFN